MAVDWQNCTWAIKRDWISWGGFRRIIMPGPVTTNAMIVASNQDQCRRQMERKKKIGTRARSGIGNGNWSSSSLKNSRIWVTNALGSSAGARAWYCPRVTAWWKPSNVRGYPQLMGGLKSEEIGMRSE